MPKCVVTFPSVTNALWIKTLKSLEHPAVVQVVWPTVENSLEWKVVVDVRELEEDKENEYMDPVMRAIFDRIRYHTFRTYGIPFECSRDAARIAEADTNATTIEDG